MSFTNDVIIGVAELLADADVGSWSPTGTYGSTDTAIVTGRLPQRPLSAIGLTPYPVLDEVGQPSDDRLGILGVQLRFRGRSIDIRDAQDLQDAAFDVLHNREYTNLHGRIIPLIWRAVSAPPETNENDQYEIADSYYFHYYR